VIYPGNFEKKIGAEKIREIVMDLCNYDPGRSEIKNLYFSSDFSEVSNRLL